MHTKELVTLLKTSETDPGNNYISKWRLTNLNKKDVYIYLPGQDINEQLHNMDNTMRSEGAMICLQGFTFFYYFY